MTKLGPTPNVAILKLHSLYLGGEIRGPEKHEVSPGLEKGSRENYLYYTLPCAINFQRNSPALWYSALKTYEDPSTRSLFFPEKVVRKPHNEIKRDMAKHRLAAQTNKHPHIWSTLCQTLNALYDNDPRQILAEGSFDIPTIINILQNTRKSDFPYLGGVKLSNYWLFILHEFTDAQFKRVHELSIIPDTHVIKSTVKLGLAPEGVSSRAVEQIWRGILRELDISPTQMHSALWRWSRNGFKPDLC